MRIISFVVALTAALPCAVWAQGSSSVIDRSRPDRTVVAPVQASMLVAPPPAEIAPLKITPFVSRSVTIEGSSLAPTVLATVRRPFVGRTLDAKALGEIANAVAQAYADKGNIALYTVVVPDQSFESGALRLSAIEGFIEHIELSGDVGGRLELVTKYSSRLTMEHPLTRSTFQRCLSLIRDIPGLSVEAKLLRGNMPGAVRLLLVLSQKTWHLTLSANDQGSDPLGRVQLQAKASLYGLLREGEETSLTVAVPTVVRRLQYVGFSESQPSDDDGTQLQGMFGYLRTRPEFPFPSGIAKNWQFLVSHPFLRGYDENLYLTASMDGIDSSNATLAKSLPTNASAPFAFPESTARRLTNPPSALAPV